MNKEDLDMDVLKDEDVNQLHDLTIEPSSDSTVDLTIDTSSASTESSIILTEEQEEAVAKIEAWFRSGQPQFCLGGYAGTGKTTIMKHVLKRLKTHHAACAFTGKAASVLTRKGVNASTIHSLIYEIDEDPKTKELIFRKTFDLPFRLIVIDEASMVSKDLYEDLKSFNIPMLCVGDPGQLPPVGDNPGLMNKPDFILETIHRQALDSGIIRLANYIRTKRILPVRDVTYNRGNDVVFRNKKINTSVFREFDQVIVAKNKTRTLLNMSARKAFGFFDQGPLVVGEKLICTKNNKRMGTFNGQIFFVQEIRRFEADYATIVIKDEFDKTLIVDAWMTPFINPDFDEKKEYCSPELVKFDYAYAITCHKSQGSEWDKVLVFDEWMPPKIWDMCRWRYTAVTRAAKELTFCID